MLGTSVASKLEYNDYMGYEEPALDRTDLRSGVGCVEITLNIPPTAAFKRMNSEEQKDMYKQEFKRLVQYMIDNKIPVKDAIYVLEPCKSGVRWHLHASITVLYEKYLYYSPVGLTSDIAKLWLDMLPPRYRPWRHDCMNLRFARYQSPSICVQTTGIERREYWHKYMSKTGGEKYMIIV